MKIFQTISIVHEIIYETNLKIIESVKVARRYKVINREVAEEKIT